MVRNRESLVDDLHTGNGQLALTLQERSVGVDELVRLQIKRKHHQQIFRLRRSFDPLTPAPWCFFLMMCNVDLTRCPSIFECAKSIEWLIALSKQWLWGAIGYRIVVVVVVVVRVCVHIVVVLFHFAGRVGWSDWKSWDTYINIANRDTATHFDWFDGFPGKRLT